MSLFKIWKLCNCEFVRIDFFYTWYRWKFNKINSISLFLTFVIDFSLIDCSISRFKHVIFDFIRFAHLSISELTNNTFEIHFFDDFQFHICVTIYLIYNINRRTKIIWISTNCHSNFILINQKQLFKFIDSSFSWRESQSKIKSTLIIRWFKNRIETSLR